MKKNKTTEIAITAMMIAFVAIAILFIKVPIPFTQGFVHLGDGLILFSLLLLGWKYGAVAGACGAALGDLISGYAMWAPWSFVLKAVMVVVAGLIIEKLKSSKLNFSIVKIVAMVIGGLLMVAGYYIAEGVMYGNFTAPLISIPWNVGQLVVGIVIAVVLEVSISKSQMKAYFKYATK